MQAIIFDIKRCSQDDGQGIRTTIFFKGCNLNCFWCHNPEGKSKNKQYAFFENKCKRCGTCKNEIDKGFEELVNLCPYGARKVYGKEYSVKELLDIILKDKDYYLATEGGVTFSGGECMLQVDFITELAKCCKENGVSVAIDTAGNLPYSSFEKVLPYVDAFLYDIKCLDNNLHKKGTGQDNLLILENLERLTTTGKNILIRVPVIPNFNDNAELEKIKEYCNKHSLKAEFLSYHEYGKDKEKAINFMGEYND